MKSILVIILSIVFSTNLFAKDEVKIKSKKFDNWVVECRKANNQENCELVQLLTVKETNVQFKLLYSIFKNQEGKVKEIFSIITPLGVNLVVNPAIRFDGGKQYNSRYIRCEVFGCVIRISNNTKDKKVNEISDEIVQKLLKSKELEIGLQIFNSKPFIIKTSLKGFSKGQAELKKKL